MDSVEQSKSASVSLTPARGKVYGPTSSHRYVYRSWNPADAESMMGLASESQTETGIVSIVPKGNHTIRQESQQGAESTFDYGTLLRGLRGRIWLAVVLALIGSAAGGFLGWRITAPVYQCEGLIRIAYILPSVMRQTDQNGPIAMYETFLRSQQLVMQSRRIIELALSDPAWQATGQGTSAEQVRRIAAGLVVDHPNNTENLHVAVKSSDPVIAAAAVKSIIDVFAVDYNKNESLLQAQRLKTLDDRESELTARIGQLESQSGVISEEFGGADLDRMYDQEDQQLLDLGRELTDVRLALAVARGAASNVTPDPVQHEASDANLSIEQIGMRDAVMHGYLLDEERYGDQLAQLTTVGGLGDSNPEVVLLKSKLQRVREHIATYAEEYRKLQLLAPPLPVASSQAPVSGFQSVESLQAEEAALTKEYEKAKVELPNLLKKRHQLEDVKSAAADARRELNEITERRESLRVESAVGGRLEIISTGEVPVAPLTDRRQEMAAAAALFGGLLPVALLAVIGLRRRRLLVAGDTTVATSCVGELELLGILPALDEKSSHPDDAANAAHSVHQIRVRMQAAQQACRSNVYLVTSASPGEGKTNITTAMALSFAASGSRTLLIDFDLVGRRLTCGLRAEQSAGLQEALATGNFRALKAGPNLDVLSAGITDALHACTVASGPIRRLINECRNHYDVIFIDSGPILGSIEASVVAPEVDGVALVVSRGQKPELVDRALHQLNALGARMAGVIFNRANAVDFARSCPVSSSSRSTGTLAAFTTRGKSESPDFDLGPLVRAVVTHLPNMA